MAAKKRAAPPAAEEHVGTVEHYYPKVQAAAVRLDGDLKVGDTIHVKGATDDVIGKVRSLQLDHQPVQEGHAGESVGVGIPVKVHEHSEVRKVLEPGASQGAGASAKPARRAAPKADVRRRGTVRTRKSAGSPRKRARKATVARAAARSRSPKPAARPRKGKAARSKRAAKRTARRSTARRAKRASPARKSAKRRGR